MSEATPSPDPQPGGNPTDPTAPPAEVPASTSWAPPDPLAAPTPWASPTPWSPADETAATGLPGAAGRPGSTNLPGAAGQPDPPAPAGYPPAAAAHPAPIGPADPSGGPSPAAPGGATPPPGHPWPGHPAPAWPPAGYPPPYAYPGQTPPSRTNGGRIAAIVVGVVAAVVALVCCACLGLSALGSFFEEEGVGSSEPYEPGYGTPDDDALPPHGDPATTPSDGPGELTVVYEVSGTETVDIQFYDANADFFQIDEVRTPWRMTFTADDRERVQVLAEPIGSGEVTCRITINGKVVSEESGGWRVVCFGW
ncbi:MmpS family transport accessory protein [Micromonospora sp. NPDC093277]|uniref:MmpS family transport accessory protein n=1 Tax=Micromonospora sp. NPDC093277 TaxID=3364291 RepID=UPI0037F9B0AA